MPFAPTPLRRALLLALAALPLAFSAGAHADEGAIDAGLLLRPQSDLIDPALRRGEVVPTFGMGDTISGTLDTDVTLQGHAELRRNGASIKADQIHYLQVEDELFANGAVRIYRDGNVYTGPELRLRLDDYTGYFLKPEYSFAKTGGRGNADRVNFLGREKSELLNPIYTTCTPGNYDWYVKADQLQLDQSTDTGEGRNAVVYFKGVPILASPYISFPLSDARQSGFLPPTLSVTSNSGAEVLLPYYWNIAPNRDFTLYPKFMSRRGLQLGGDFRYLEPNYHGETRYEALDDRTTGTARSLLSLQHQWTGLGDLAGFSANVNFNRVSDDNYFVDFSRTIAAASTRTLPRDASVSYGASYWTLQARVLRYQTLQDPQNPIAQPYDKLPQITFHGARLDLGGFDFNLDADLTRFSNTGMVGGDRFVLNPSVSYPIVRPGWFVTPKVSYNATHYNLTDTAVGQPNQFDRSLPTVSLDAGLIFERDSSLLGSSFRQTLEPRLFYTRTPYRDQSQYPNFDSGLPDFNFSQLFAENTFSGYDRIADTNQLTAAVTTRYLNPETGAEVLRAAIGQRFYLSDQLVTLPGGSPVQSRKSDFLAAASGEVLPNISVDAGIQYNPSVGGVSRSGLAMRWQPEPTKVLNLGYRYIRGEFDQYDISGQWPLGAGWYGVGRVNYSSRDRQVVQSLAGVEYNGCCWVLRIAAQKFATGTLTSTTTLFIQLELNGFSRLGSNPLDALKRNISGYQPINMPATAPSPFNNYE